MRRKEEPYKTTEIQRERAKRQRQDKPEVLRRSNLAKYGITPGQYVLLERMQKGLCAICFKPEVRIDYRTGKLQKLSVDHDHATGKVRGLLCTQCNTGLGKFYHDVNQLESAIRYLERSA